MLKVRLSALACAGLVALAISVATTGTALAETFTLSTEKCNGSVLNLCWNNGTENLELVGKQTFVVGKKPGAQNVVFHATLSEEAFTIECEAVTTGSKGKNIWTQNAPLTETGGPSFTLTPNKCKLTAPAALAKKCAVPAEKETSALVGGLTSVSELKISPEAGETSPFIELEFKNNGSETCPSTFKTGLHAVTGTQVVTILNPEVAEESKSGETVVKSGLKLGGNAAELSMPITVTFIGLGDKIVSVKKA